MEGVNKVQEGNDVNKIDPFGNSIVKDYNKLITELGLRPVDESILKRIKRPSRCLRRGIDFAHLDLDKFLDAVEAKKKTVALHGIKPTGEFHLGSKMTAEKLIYFQKEFGSKIYYLFADLEGMLDNNISLEEATEICAGNLADLLALGLDPKNAYIYRQSQQMEVMRMAYTFAKKVTDNFLRGLYGERPIGIYMAALVQQGDILLPQTKEHEGPCQVCVVGGADQVPHVHFTRDLIKRPGFNFLPPSTLVHKFFRALNGEYKMSKRDPMSSLTLNDKPELARKKIMSTLTGGRETVEIQKKMGGEPGKCVVYELAEYHFEEDDKKLKERKEQCKSGKLLCGECKNQVCKLVQNYLENHQAKRNKFLPKARKILES